MFIKIIGIFAEFERENLIERVKMGIDRKVKEGYSICSNTPSYGYCKNKGENIQQPKEDEAYIVNLIFDLYLKDYSFLQIAKLLNHKKIPTKKNKTWTSKTIKLILTNPNYIGKVRHNINTKNYTEIDGKHQSIVDKEKFIAVSKKLKNDHLIFKTKKAYKDAFLTKYLKCNLCGGYFYPKRTIINNKTFISYYCKNKRNKTCDQKSISHLRINKEINFYLQKNAFYINWLKLKDEFKIEFLNMFNVEILIDRKDNITIPIIKIKPLSN